MKRLLSCWLLSASALLPQAATFTYAGPTLSPPANPGCSVSPFSFTQSATYTWQTGCGNGALAYGILSGTGTGYCSGLGINCLINYGQPAPYFSFFYQQDASGT
ncbi:MAG TPA: hypothetical protein VHU83_13030 [Bryobacteraceae bacterium]|nr:hypothetical protein [Bryobacteraceae bacterium]